MRYGYFHGGDGKEIMVRWGWGYADMRAAQVAMPAGARCAEHRGVRARLRWGTQVADVWKAAGHTHHEAACVECWLLPTSLNVELSRETPHVREMRKIRALSATAVKMQRWFRVARARRAELAAARPATERFVGLTSERAVPVRRANLFDDLIRSLADDAEKEQLESFARKCEGAWEGDWLLSAPLPLLLPADSLAVALQALARLWQ